jgi:hypothetical protein
MRGPTWAFFLAVELNYCKKKKERRGGKKKGKKKRRRSKEEREKRGKGGRCNFDYC